MKRLSLNYKLWVAMFHTILLGMIVTSCSMMDTDRSDCPEGLYVNFVYDYNIQRADMFKDHVGYVTVYVFDESDNLVIKRSVGNYGDNCPLRTYGYQMHFTLPEGIERCHTEGNITVGNRTVASLVSDPDGKHVTITDTYTVLSINIDRHTT